MEWAFERGERVFFFPDQHLGRNTALAMGIDEPQMPVWDPYAMELGGNTEAGDRKQPSDSVERTLQRPPNVSCRACRHVSQTTSRESRYWFIRSAHEKSTIWPMSRAARARSSKRSSSSPAGTKWAIGTELHLVNRLKAEHPGTGNPFPQSRRLHVRNDVPHRLAPSLLVARESSRRPDRQQDRSRRRDGQVEPDCPGANVGGPLAEQRDAANCWKPKVSRRLSKAQGTRPGGPDTPSAGAFMPRSRCPLKIRPGGPVHPIGQ